LHTFTKKTYNMYLHILTYLTITLHRAMLLFFLFTEKKLKYKEIK
jgi:hypothetical protein